MESASLLAFAGALPPLPFGPASVDMIADEKSVFCKSNAYESQPMIVDAKINAMLSEWSRRDANELVDAPMGRCKQRDRVESSCC